MRILPPMPPDLILPMSSAEVLPRTLLASLDLVLVSSPVDVVVERPTKNIVSAGSEEEADRASSPILPTVPEYLLPRLAHDLH